jgi:hypothetical protein
MTFAMKAGQGRNLRSTRGVEHRGAEDGMWPVTSATTSKGLP